MFPRKSCRVCGNGASGFNYNALSCASCKVFFYRNEVRKDKLTCPQNGNCSMEVKLGGRRCMKCRMVKCLNIGMTRYGLHDSKDSIESVEIPKIVVNSKMLKNFIEEKYCRIEKLLEILIKTSIESVEIEPANQRFDCKSVKVRSPKGLKLNILELQQISAYIQRTRSIFVEESSIQVLKQARTYEDFSQPYQLYMRRIAKFCKQITAYNQLNSDDQYQLFKWCCFSFLTIRTAYFYDCQMDGFVITENDAGSSGVFRKFDFGRDASLPNILKFNKDCTIALHTEMENDATIRDLLAVQQLFKPHAGTSNREFIRYQYTFYSQLLQRYLQDKYRNWRQAASKYSLLMRLVGQFPLMRENKAILLTMYDNKLPHIFLEIFNLV